MGAPRGNKNAAGKHNMSGQFRRTNAGGGRNFNAGTARWRRLEQPMNKWQKRGRLRQQLDPYEASGKGVWLNDQGKKTAGQLRNEIQQGLKTQMKTGYRNKISKLMASVSHAPVSRGFKQRMRIKSHILKVKTAQKNNMRKSYGG